LEIVGSEELNRWLKKQGCTFGMQEGSHLKVYRGDRFTVIPMHGKKELKPGTLRAILRDLGLR
jgi:mRNA interferase HicA